MNNIELDVLILKKIMVYLKFKFKWASFIESANPLKYKHASCSAEIRQI